MKILKTEHKQSAHSKRNKKTLASSFIFNVLVVRAYVLKIGVVHILFGILGKLFVGVVKKVKAPQVGGKPKAPRAQHAGSPAKKGVDYFILDVVLRQGKPGN